MSQPTHILITGASGLVGGNCLRFSRTKKDYRVTGTHFSYPVAGTLFFNASDFGDPRNAPVLALRPEILIHCGALSHVDRCEEHEEESYLHTVISARNMTEWAKTLHARLVYISSDYVFDGKNGPYGEDAVPHPISVYGKHKREAEKRVMQKGTRSIVIRITNVYGDEERKKNFVLRIADRLAKGEALQLQLPGDQYATPVNAWDVARAIDALISSGVSGIYHLAGSDYLSRVELAEKIRSRFPGASMQITPVSTASLNQPARRPLKGGLKADKFKREFPSFVFSTVDDYLAQFITGGQSLPPRDAPRQRR